MHFFEFEYFQDDLIVVFFNSISDSGSADRSFEGFSKDAIPDRKDVIRIDLLGGMAFQKVSATRSYFRTIANMDIKLDFVPPSIINFVSRQLMGSGFMLYKKEVAAVTKGNEDFSKALEDPLHCRVREALYSNNKQLSLQSEIIKDTSSEDEIVDSGHKTVAEIEEVEEENADDSRELEENGNEILDPAHKNKYKEDEKGSSDSNKRKVAISPQVKQALDTLEKAISFFRENRSSNSRILRSCSSSRRRAGKESKPSGEDLNDAISSEVAKDENMARTSNELRISFGSRSSRRMGSNPYTREANHSNKIVPSLIEVNPLHPSEPRHMSLQDDFSFHRTGVDASFSIENNNEVSNGVHHKQQASANLENGRLFGTKSKGKHRKLRSFCCLSASSEQF